MRTLGIDTETMLSSILCTLVLMQECGGSSICEHKRQRSSCKECKGSSLCPHDRQKSRCKDCGGSGICMHGRQRRNCKVQQPLLRQRNKLSFNPFACVQD